MLFGAQFVWRQQKQNTREGTAARGRKEKEPDLLSTSQEWKTKTGKLSGDSYAASQQEGSPALRDTGKQL